jgi:hypothetical protein
MALKGRIYPTWLYSEKRGGVLVKNAQEEDDLGVPVFDNPNLGKPRDDQGYMKQAPAPAVTPGYVARRAKAGASPTGEERRHKSEQRVKAGFSPTGKERRIFPRVA